jgi:nitroreductase
MEFMTVLQNRVSCRAYDPKRVIPKEQLVKIAEAGKAAPSAANLQPWKFLFISSPELLGKVRECYSRRWIDSAPHILIVKGSRTRAWVRRDGYNSLETDLTIAMDHMILAAENFGIASCWIAAFDNEKLREVLNIQSDEEVFAITPLGYSADGSERRREKKRYDLERVAEFI